MLQTVEIKSLIDEDTRSAKKIQAAVGQRYYEGEHDIKQSRLFFYNADGVLEEDKTRSNIKISHPFFTELSDQLTAHVLSFKKSPIRARAKAEGLQDKIDIYFDEEFWAEVSQQVGGAYNKGSDYIYGYKNAEDRLAFAYSDGMGVVEVEAKTASDNQKHILYWYVEKINIENKPVIKIQDWTEQEIYYYIQEDWTGTIEVDKTVEINPRPHIIYTNEETGKKYGQAFGFIPFWRLDYNRKQISGLKPIKAIIDDYDLHACSLSNNLVDFDTPLYVVNGFQGDSMDELFQNVKTKKMIGTDAEGGVSVQTVSIPIEARRAKLEIDEKNIYRFGMGLNTAGLKDTSATTNIAIKSAYELLNIKANKLITELKKMLRGIIKVVIAEINSKEGTDYQPSDVYFDWQLTTLTNETENIANDLTKANTEQVKINTILNIAMNVGDEQTLKAICDVMDWDFEEIKAAVEKAKNEEDLEAAKNALNNVVVDE